MEWNPFFQIYLIIHKNKEKMVSFGMIVNKDGHKQHFYGSVHGLWVIHKPNHEARDRCANQTTSYWFVIPSFLLFLQGAEHSGLNGSEF